MTTSLINTLVSRHEGLEAARVPWESHWRDAARYTAPELLDQFTTVVGGIVPQPGRKVNTELYDSSGIDGVLVWAAMVENMLIPRTQRWHTLKLPQSMGAEVPHPLALWLEQVTDALFHARYGTRSNFADQMQEYFLSLGVFGTAALFVEMGRKTPIRYRSIPISEIFIDVDDELDIDYVHRKFTLTARQAVQTFGDALPRDILAAAGDPQKRLNTYQFVHCVYPNYEQGEKGGFPYTSTYLEWGQRKIVQQSGYWTMPYIVSRARTAPGEMYGRSPTMVALPHLKTLNRMKYTVLRQGELAADPAYLLYDGGVLSEFSIRPGALNFGGVSSDGKSLVQRVPTGDVGVGVDLMALERAAIERIFYVSLFNLLDKDPRKTATQVLEENKEKASLLFPLVGRQQGECLGPLISRELDILARMQGLPPPPEGVEADALAYMIEYDTPLTRAMKSEAAVGVTRLTEQLSLMASTTGDTSVFDSVNYDRIVPFLAKVHALRADFLRPPEEIAAIRESRAQQAQMQQAAEMAPGAAQVIKAVQGGVQ